MIKERRTDTHVYFYGGPLSQWYKCSFEAVPYRGFDKVRFNCAEQYMMAAKALLFGDREAYDAIMLTDSPSLQKRIGRLVKNYDYELWSACRENFVILGNNNKFIQNNQLKYYLLYTGERILVEGSPTDKIWGVGLSYDSKEIEDESNWQGLNLLGKALMTVRSNLKDRI